MNLKPYMIPREYIATEGITDTLKGASIIGIALLGLGLTISDWKKDKANKERMKAEANKAKTAAAAKAAWFESAEGQACKRRLQQKYGQDININSAKLKKAIEADITKIGKKINSDKKTCKQWFEEYMKYAKNDLFAGKELPKYVIEDTKEILSGPCAVPPEDYSDNTDWTWAICDIEQIARAWLCDAYLFDAYTNALNTKYADEISWGILKSFKWVGDGDEGLIGTRYQPIFDHIRGV